MRAAIRGRSKLRNPVDAPLANHANGNVPCTIAELAPPVGSPQGCWWYRDASKRDVSTPLDMTWVRST